MHMPCKHSVHAMLVQRLLHRIQHVIHLMLMRRVAVVPAHVRVSLTLSCTADAVMSTSQQKALLQNLLNQVLNHLVSINKGSRQGVSATQENVAPE